MKFFKKILLIISSLTFIISVVLLLKLLVIEPLKNENINNKIRNTYLKSVEKSEKASDKFSELKKINSDIIGWIKIENTEIDYPVVASPKGSRDYYLSHDFEKNSSAYGAIFVIGEDDILSDQCKNICTYGHHMKNGSMFAGLIGLSDLKNYKKSPYIYFHTVKKEDEEKVNWKIFATFKANTLPEHGEVFNYLIPKFDNSDDFKKFIDNIKMRSLLDIPVEVKPSDQILTLSTCSYEFPEFRTVLVARKLRDGESLEVDTSKAKKATDPLMPDIWYK